VPHSRMRRVTWGSFSFLPPRDRVVVTGSPASRSPHSLGAPESTRGWVFEPGVDWFGALDPALQPSAVEGSSVRVGSATPLLSSEINLFLLTNIKNCPI